MYLKIIDMSSTDPYLNIASEYRYYECVKDYEIILILRQNQPSVIMGRNQNIYQELNLSYILDNDIKPVRRFTGGGSVYHDLGNLNFSIITKNKYKDINKWLDIIIKALHNLNIDSHKEGRNDLISQGRKISGMAFLEDDEKILFHGTLMVNLNMDILIRSLTPNIYKFKGKGIKSVKSRVINLNEINKDISIKALKENIINEFIRVYPNFSIETYTIKTRDLEIEMNLRSHDWIYGKNERAEIKKIINIGNRMFVFYIRIKDGEISNVEIYTDSLNLRAVEDIKRSLINKNYEEIFWEDIGKSHII